MPLYEYICRTCHKKCHEALTTKEHDMRRLCCPNCQGGDREKVIGKNFALAVSKTGAISRGSRAEASRAGSC